MHLLQLGRITCCIWLSLPCVADADIIFCPVVSSSFYLFYSSPILSCCRLDVYQGTKACGLSENLGCRSEMCCKWLTENTGRKNSPKIRHLDTMAQLCQAISSQLRHISTIGKKFVKQHYPRHMFSEYGELRPISSWDRFTSLEHPSKFQRVSHLAVVTAATSLTGGQPNFAQCLAISWPGTLYMHFRGLLPPDGILHGAKFTLRQSLALSYIGSVTAQHSSSGRQPNFVAWYKEWNYGTFAEGATYIWLGSHHVGHRPTF